MRGIAYIILTIFTLSSCSAQKIINAKSKDVLVFNFKKENVILTKFYAKVYNQDGTYKTAVESSENREVNSKGNFSIITQDWQALGNHYYQKKYSFVLEKDTMNISCKCGQERNYYFKNLEFKKGNYELKFEIPNNRIKGSEIETSKEVQKILFKNAYVPNETPTQQDKYFKDLLFFQVNLEDTINVKLTKIE
ncbi:MAG: hypothetical protein ACK5MD_11105 [Flavobacteriales bacterium]